MLQCTRYSLGILGLVGVLYLRLITMRGHYFVGSKLWDLLLREIIEIPDVFLKFKMRLKRLNKTYVSSLA